MLLLALVGLVHASVLAQPGERLADAQVVAVEEHDEFERLTLRLADGSALVVEAAETRADREGACEAHGLVLMPRWELRGEQVEAEDQPAVIAALCERLRERGGALRLEDAPPSPPPSLMPPPWQRPFPWHWLHGLVAAVIALSAVSLRPAWRGLTRAEGGELAIVGAVGVLARLALSPLGLLIGPDAGLERVVMSWGSVVAHPLYGGGYAAIFSPLAWLTGYHPQALFWGNLGLACLAPPLLWGVARLWAGRSSALLAGLGLALLPVHLRLAGTEVMHISLLTAELLAALAALGFRRTGARSLGMLAAGAAGLAVHIRPEALPFLVVPGALLWRRRGGLPLLALVALVLPRVWALRGAPIAVAGPGLWTLQTWVQALVPPGSADAHVQQVWLNPWLTPVALPLLALVGLCSWRRALPVVGWWALVTLPMLPKSWPLVDALRLQLSAQAPSLLLAGMGGAWLVRRWGGRWILIGVVTLGALPWLGSVSAPWLPRAEWNHLRQSLSTVAEGETLWVDGQATHGDKLVEVAQVLSRARAQVVGERSPAEGDLAWRGLTCVDTPEDCEALDACELIPVQTWHTRAPADSDLRLPPGGAELGLYRVGVCGD